MTYIIEAWKKLNKLNEDTLPEIPEGEIQYWYGDDDGPQEDSISERFIKDKEGQTFGVDTCVVGAIQNAYNLSWEEAWKHFDDYFDLRSLEGKGISWTHVTRVANELGYIKLGSVPRKDGLTVSEFAKQYPTGVYLVDCIGAYRGKEMGHVTCIKDGDIYDTFNPGKFIVDKYVLVSNNDTDRV